MHLETRGRGKGNGNCLLRAVEQTVHSHVHNCTTEPPPPPSRDALEGKGPHRRPQRRLDRRLEEVAKAVGSGYCRLQMLLKLALAVRGTVAGHRLGAL